MGFLPLVMIFVRRFLSSSGLPSNAICLKTRSLSWHSSVGSCVKELWLMSRVSRSASWPTPSKLVNEFLLSVSLLSLGHPDSGTASESKLLSALRVRRHVAPATGASDVSLLLATLMTSSERQPAPPSSSNGSALSSLSSASRTRRFGSAASCGGNTRSLLPDTMSVVSSRRAPRPAGSDSSAPPVMARTCRCEHAHSRSASSGASSGVSTCTLSSRFISSRALATLPHLSSASPPPPPRSLSRRLRLRCGTSDAGPLPPPGVQERGRGQGAGALASRGRLPQANTQVSRTATAAAISWGRDPVTSRPGDVTQSRPLSRERQEGERGGLPLTPAKCKAGRGQEEWDSLLLATSGVMATAATPVAKTKAEVNLLRLAASFERDGVAAREAGGGDGGEPEWRKLEAYARRMRELLVEVRRGDAPPPAERLAEYEGMLAAAAAAADDARRKQDGSAAGKPAEVRCQLPARAPAASACPYPDRAGRGAGARLQRAQQTTSERASEPATEPAVQPGSLAGAPVLHAPVGSSLPQSLADRRSQLLGSAQPRLRVGKRGGAGGGHGSHLQEQLAADRKLQQRMQEELANMTGTLKR